MHVIDRRRNPQAKSTGNRGRFLRRVKSHIRKAVGEAVRDRKIADVAEGQSVSISAGDVSEPTFVFDGDVGDREYVLPGNQDYQRGDRIGKPSGGGGAGKKGGADGDGEDPFMFLLSRDEFLDLFFEDLELPNLAAKRLKALMSESRVRAGLSNDGSPQRLNLRETMRRSLARRIALHRPKGEQLVALEKKLEEAEAADDEDEIVRLKEKIEAMKVRMRAVAYLDNVDLRYNHYERRPKATTQAVMFCLMDTSASMTEDLKDLAKRFFILLHLFLTRHYQAVELVFIRHTYTAKEVDEDTFFHGRETGGTVVSSALEEMAKVIATRYPVDDWNIYAAQASDGHNFDHDMPRTMSLLKRSILPMCQYYAYIEVTDEPFFGESLLWEAYNDLAETEPHFQAARVTEPSEIYPVFHELFSNKR